VASWEANMNMLTVGSRAEWRDQAREDYCTFRTAALIVGVDPDDLRWALGGLEPGDVEDAIRHLVQAGVRYRQAVATLEAAQDRLEHPDRYPGSLDRLREILTAPVQ